MDDATREDDKQPVINLDEVRERRRVAAEEEARARARALRLAWQRHTLTEAILAKRMSTSDLLYMLRLGIVTDNEEMLPCQDRSDPGDYFDWLRKANNMLSPEEREEELQPQYPGEPDWSREERLEPQPRHTVDCPLMATGTIAEESPPCIEVLKMQATEELWTEDGGFVTKPLDENDLVVKYQVRPCALIGNYALIGVMKPVWDRQEEEKEEEDDDE